MEKKAPPAYPSLAVAPPDSSVPSAVMAAGQQQAKPARMRDRADQVVLYLEPAAHKELKRFALGANCKVHDLLIEAVEEWAMKRGIREQIRVR